VLAKTLLAVRWSTQGGLVTASRREALVALVGLVALAALAYAPVRRYPYVQDAYAAVQTNPVVERASPREIFTSDYWKDTPSPTHTLYRPVTVLSFALERVVVGRLDPGVSHGVNVALHAIVAWLLFLLARALRVRTLGASAAALVFAAHPLLLQAVANVVGRADLLVAFFGLAATLVWVREARTPWAERARAWGSAALVLLALFSKEIAIAIPPLLLLFQPRRAAHARALPLWRKLAPVAPLALALLLYLHARTIAIGEFPGEQPVAREDSVLIGLAGQASWATALGMVSRYAALFLWPARSSPDYSGTAIPVEPSLLAARPLAGLAILACALWIALRGRDRAASLGASLALLSYAIVGNLLVLNAAGFAERMLYVPAAGICLTLGAGLALAASGIVVRRAATIVLLLVVVLGVTWTRRSVPMWESGLALFERTRVVAPRSLRGNLERATRLEAQGQFDDALAAWRELTEIEPNYGGAWRSMGVLLARNHRFAEAETALRRAIALDPQIGETRLNLGLVLVARGERGAAERELRRALLLDSSLVRAAAQLAHLRFDAGRYAEAARLYRQCVERGRDDLVPRWHEAEARALTAARPIGEDRRR
jgi:tetratricopeptide (TPR) repeat protein